MTNPTDHAPVEDYQEEHSRESPDDIRRLASIKSWEEFRQHAVSLGFDKKALMGRVEKIYSTSQAAAFLGRSPQWIYWGLNNNVFTHKDGTSIQPERVGAMGRRRFTIPLIREIALSHHRRGNMTEDELEDVIKRLLLAEYGPDAFSSTSKRRK